MGWGELLWWRISEAGSNNGVMVLEVEGHTDIDRLKYALEQVSLTHPLLRCRGVRDGKRGRIEVPAQGVAPLRVIPRRDDKHWIEVAENEVNQAVSNETYPLWHLVAIVGNDHAEWILVINHAIVDGLSANLFYDLLLRIYSGEAPPAPRAMPPAFDTIIKHGGALPLARYTWAYLRGMFGRPPVKKFPMAAGVDPEVLGRSRIVEHTLDEATTKALAARCKTQRLTLNGLLSSAMLIAACDGVEGQAPHRIAMSFAMNLRPLLTVNVNEDFGYYVTGAEADHVVSPNSDPWPLARQTMQDASRVFHGEHVKVNSWLRQVILKIKPTGQSLLDAAPKSSRACFHITNMGKLSMPTQYGDLRIRRWFHSSSVHLARRPFVCLSSIAYAGRLQLTFGYCEPHTDRAMVDRVVGRFLSILDRVAKGEL